MKRVLASDQKLIVYVVSGAVLFALLLYAINIAFLSAPDGSSSEINGSQNNYPESRTIRYSFTVRNKTNRYLEGADFWTYAPVKQTSFQLEKSIGASHEFTTKVDEAGNQKLRFKLDLAPFSAKVVSITAQLKLAKKSNEMEINSTVEYTGREKYIELDNEKIIALSQQFTGDEKNISLKTAFDWVAENIEYAGYIEDDRGALYALNNKRGDCTEYMYLFAALARLKDIPTRAVGGYVVSEDAVLKAQGFHNWAEVYVDGKWRVADPQNKKFMEDEDSYIAMHVISPQVSSSNSLLSNTQRFSYAGEGLEVRMN